MSDEQQRQIYQTDGDRYEALIAREDHQGLCADDRPRAHASGEQGAQPAVLRRADR